MHLEITLLGSFQAFIGGEPATSFASNKARALLAYLAAESERPQQREALADLLWPDWPQKSAMRNLSYVLANLRKTIGDREAESPILIVSRDGLQTDREGDVWVDIWEFDQKTRNPLTGAEQLKSAVELYRGAFLEGFSLSDSAPFEEWLATQRELVQRQMLKLLYELVEVNTKQGKYELALLYARRQLALEAWHEPAHRQIMLLLTQQGQRVEALAQFERLHAALEQAVQGNGGVMLVTGGPGHGKSMLLGEFVRQAVARHPHLLAASGNYQAYFGRGDPYLTFREILAMLTGDVEARWLAGTINLELAHQLWAPVPHTARALVESGPALIETPVPGETLINYTG